MDWHVWWDQFQWLMTGGDPQAPWEEVAIRGSLLGCSAFALLQFLTMLITRWGDHHAMGKSFVLSVLLHVCLGLGWQTVAIEFDKRKPILSESSAEAIKPQPVTLASETPTNSTSESGAIPIWQQLLDQPEPEWARVDRPVEQPIPESLPEPEPLSDPFTEPPLPITEAKPLLDENDPDQDLAHARATEPKVADLDMALEEPTAEARTDAPRFARSARSAGPAANINEAPPSATPPLPAPRRDTNPIPTGQSIPLDTNNAVPNIARPQGEPSDRIVQRSALTPLPSVAVTENTGTAPADSPSVSTTPTGNGKRFQRQRPTGKSLAEASGDAELPAALPGGNGDRSRETLASRLAARAPSATAIPQAEMTPGALKRATKNEASTRGPARMPETYSLRKLQQRRSSALKNGGTAATERAVELSLKFLANQQEADGRWDSARHGGGTDTRNYTDAQEPYSRAKDGVEADTGVTALAVLAFLGAGYTHEEGAYAPNVERALRWLIQAQQQNGYLGGGALERDQMYCHAVATYAMAEALGMQSDPETLPALQPALRRAIAFTCEAQYPDGGWRYQKDGRRGQQGDMSVFGWHLMALKSAELAGIEIPEATRTGMVKFLNEASQGKDRGLMGYRSGQQVTPAMTAEALFCKQMLGLKRSSATSDEAIGYLQQRLPKMSDANDYYWYYGTLAMYQYGGDPWQEWNGTLRDMLVDTQRKQGTLAGSWDPVDPWGRIGGRIYSTALSALCLEVYYRFLPLYRIGDEP